MVGLGFATTLAAWAQGHVMVITNETTQEPLDFVAVYECTKDSVLLHTSLSDEYGRIIILNENKTELIRCERLGFETKWQQVPFPDTIRMQPTITALSEVLVCADVRPLKKTDSGFIYNMAANRRAQDESILQALNYIPFVSVSLDQ